MRVDVLCYDGVAVAPGCSTKCRVTMCPGSSGHIFILGPWQCIGAVFQKSVVCPGLTLQPVWPSVANYSGVASEEKGTNFQYMTANSASSHRVCKACAHIYFKNEKIRTSLHVTLLTSVVSLQKSLTLWHFIFVFVWTMNHIVCLKLNFSLGSHLKKTYIHICIVSIVCTLWNNNHM